jgi:DNA-binding beta-propeller fold protein YncE
MIPRLLATTCLATTLLALPVSAKEPRLFGVNSSAGDRFLVTIDKTNANLTIIGPTGIDCDGLAFAPDGTLYAADNTDPANPRLVTLDPTSGAVDQVIGSFGLGSQRWVEGLSFHPVTGELFGIDTKPDNLVKIDLATGIAKIIGPFGAPTESAGLSFSKSGSALYLIDWMDGCLYAVDPTTGSATVIGCGDVEEPLGLATDPTDGQLFSADLSSGPDMILSRVDTSTGQRTDVGIMVGGTLIEGLAFEPDSNFAESRPELQSVINQLLLD